MDTAKCPAKKPGAQGNSAKKKAYSDHLGKPLRLIPKLAPAKRYGCRQKGPNMAITRAGLFSAARPNEQIKAARQEGQSTAHGVWIDFWSWRRKCLRRATHRGKDQKKTANLTKPLETVGDQVSESLQLHFDFLSL
jgi:hypothetical protein